MVLSRIKKIAEEKKITLKSIADEIGMTTANLHKCVKGNRIEAGDLEMIAKVLGVPITCFFDEVEPVHNAKDSEIIELQRKYIVLLEKRLEESGERETRQAG